MTVAINAPDDTYFRVRRWNTDSEGDLEVTERIETMVSNIDVELMNDVGPELLFMCYSYTPDKQLIEYQFNEKFAELIANAYIEQLK